VEENMKKGDLQGQWGTCGDQKKEENRGFPMVQQSRGLVKKWVRYGGHKNEKLRKSKES
jgi:hypothetical protein